MRDMLGAGGGGGKAGARCDLGGWIQLRYIVYTYKLVFLIGCKDLRT